MSSEGTPRDPRSPVRDGLRPPPSALRSEIKVLLVSNYAPDAQRSMIAFADSLERGLPARGIEVRRISAPNRLLGDRSPEGGKGKWLGYLDKFVLFRPALRRAAREVDLVHLCDHGNGMLVPALKSFRLLMNCHDLIAIHAARGDTPGVHVGRMGRMFQRMNLRGIEEAEHVVCISEATRRDVASMTHRPPERTHVIPFGLIDAYPALTDGEADAILARHGLAKGTRYLFQIGVDAPYKNRVGAVRIFSRLKRMPGYENLELIFAGRPLADETRAEAEACEFKDAIRVMVDVDLDTKTALYRRAEATLFPSLFEGFGLPVVEGQTLGSPVVTSDRAPMNEVAGGAAILIDPEDPTDAARRIAEGLRDREGLIARGRANAERFTEDRMVDAYAALYRKILGSG